MLLVKRKYARAITLRTKLKKIFVKNRTGENKSRYTKQRNLCVTLLRKCKREYFNNLNKRKVCNKKKFWRAIIIIAIIKPLLSNKIVSNEKITIVKGDKIIRREKETAKVLNEFLTSHNLIKLTEHLKYQSSSH